MKNFTRLKSDTILKSFNCGTVQLNDFLVKDALLYSQNNLAHTFLIQGKSKTVAYISILNDTVAFELEQHWPKTKIKKYLKNVARLHHFKRTKDKYPAVKIARLGVDESFKSQGVGKLIINSLIRYLQEESLSACMFITVDSKPEAVEFYKKYGFSNLKDVSDGTGAEKTFPMVLCLSELSETQTKAPSGKLRRLSLLMSNGWNKALTYCIQLRKSA